MKRLFLSVGLDRVSPGSWNGWAGFLRYAVADSVAVGAIFSQGGFTSRTLLNEKATLEAMIGELEMLADLAEAGDAVVYHASGHGGDDPTQEDRQFFCADNGAFTDRKFHEMMARFKKDVKLVFIGDYCNVGGFNRGVVPLSHRAIDRRARFAPPGVRTNRRTRVGATTPLQATVLQLLACRLTEEAAEGVEANKPGHGYWSQELLDAIKPGITWKQCFDAAAANVTARNPFQHPTAYELGAGTIFPAQVFTFALSPNQPPSGEPVFPTDPGPSR